MQTRNQENGYIGLELPQAPVCVECGRSISIPDDHDDGCWFRLEAQRVEALRRSNKSTT